MNNPINPFRSQVTTTLSNEQKIKSFLNSFLFSDSDPQFALNTLSRTKNILLKTSNQQLLKNLIHDLTNDQLLSLRRQNKQLSDLHEGLLFFSNHFRHISSNSKMDLHLLASHLAMLQDDVHSEIKQRGLSSHISSPTNTPFLKEISPTIRKSIRQYLYLTDKEHTTNEPAGTIHFNHKTPRPFPKRKRLITRRHTHSPMKF